MAFFIGALMVVAGVILAISGWRGTYGQLFSALTLGKVAASSSSSSTAPTTGGGSGSKVMISSTSPSAIQSGQGVLL